MKKTLKRELKLFEVVESEAIVVSVCILLSISFFWKRIFINNLLLIFFFFIDKVKLRVAGWCQLLFFVRIKLQKIIGWEIEGISSLFSSVKDRSAVSVRCLKTLKTFKYLHCCPLFLTVREKKTLSLSICKFFRVTVNKKNEYI